MNECDRITQNPAVMGGKPCIRGMRVTVGMIIGQIRAGETIESLLAGYPYLEREDIIQALRYADAAPKKAPERDAMNHPRIRRDPKVMCGKPVIVGTRITVEHILRCLASGESEAEIVADYPPLSLEDIRAAQGYAAGYLGHEFDDCGMKPL